MLELPVLYLSRYILANNPDYYRLLLAVTREGNWEDWILYMLKGVEETARWTTAKIAAIRKLADHTREYLRERVPKIYSRELMDVIFRRPYCRIGDLVSEDIVQRQAAARYLKKLAEAGVLLEEEAGREKVFIHVKLVDMLSKESNELIPYHSDALAHMDGT